MQIISFLAEISVFVLVFTPLLCGLLLWSSLFPNHTVKIRRFAKSAAVFELVLSAVLLLNFNQANIYNYTQKLPFALSPTGITLNFTMDSLSCLLCVLCSLITLLALISAKSTIFTKHKFFYGLTLIVQSSVLGVFCSNDLFVFAMFYFLGIIPVYFLISLWGGSAAKKSANKFLGLSLFGAFMLLGATILFFSASLKNAAPIDMTFLIKTGSNLPDLIQFLCFSGFLIAFLSRIPIFPLHFFISDVLENSKTPVCILISGVFTISGAYGLIRFNLQTFWDIIQVFAPMLILLATISVIYSSIIVLSQTNLKKLGGYLLVAQYGIITAGICSLNPAGLSGAIFLCAASALVCTGFYCMTGVIYARCKTDKIPLLGGLGQKMPRLMYLSLIICAAAAGVPLTMGFFGYLTNILGLFDTTLNLGNFSQVCALINGSVILFIGISMSRMFHQVFCSLEVVQYKDAADISNHHAVILYTVCASLIIFGLYPSGITDVSANFVHYVMSAILA